MGKLHSVTAEKNSFRISFRCKSLQRTIPNLLVYE